jgi:hypothetical protein
MRCLGHQTRAPAAPFHQPHPSPAASAGLVPNARSAPNECAHAARPRSDAPQPRLRRRRWPLAKHFWVEPWGGVGPLFPGHPMPAVLEALAYIAHASCRDTYPKTFSSSPPATMLCLHQQHHNCSIPPLTHRPAAATGPAGPLPGRRCRGLNPPPPCLPAATPGHARWRAASALLALMLKPLFPRPTQHPLSCPAASG